MSAELSPPYYLGYPLQSILKMLDRAHVQPRTAIDFGCGRGGMAVTLAKRFRKCKVLGLDIDAQALKSARELARRAGVTDRCSFQQQDLRAYRSADFVHCDLATFTAVHGVFSSDLSLVGAAAALIGVGGHGIIDLTLRADDDTEAPTRLSEFGQRLTDHCLEIVSSEDKEFNPRPSPLVSRVHVLARAWLVRKRDCNGRPGTFHPGLD